MRRNLCVLLLFALLVGAASAAETTPAEQIAVTSVTLTPETLMRGDTGTVTVEIQNTGDTGVASRCKRQDIRLCGHTWPGEYHLVYVYRAGRC